MIEELERLLAAATPGPWGAGFIEGDFYEGDGRIVFPDSTVSGQVGGTAVALIVALVNAAPALIAELKELRADYTELADGFGYVEWHEGHVVGVAKPRVIISGTGEAHDFQIKEFCGRIEELEGELLDAERELRAARAVVSAARSRHTEWTAHTYDLVHTALAAYDAAVAGKDSGR